MLVHGKNEESEVPTVTKEDFLQVADLLNVYIVQNNITENLFARCAPEAYLSRASTFIRKCVLHR